MTPRQKRSGQTLAPSYDRPRCRCFKPLSIRTLLEYNEQTLRDNDFEDAWLLQKERETAAAFLQFENRLKEVDAISDCYSRWEELARGAVAGNMFDWGATAVTNIMEQGNGFGLVQAMEHIQRRPWFYDGLDRWISRVKVGLTLSYATNVTELKCFSE